jgi:NADH:ubiquinone reductase (non-electrogenic)
LISYITADRSTLSISYDYLVVSVGAEVADFGIPGVKDHAITLKEVENAIHIQRMILESLEQANSMLLSGKFTDDQINAKLHWVIVGGGPSGVELTAELCDFVNDDVQQYFPNLKDRVQITLIEATDRILPSFDPSISSYAEKSLVSQGANVLCKTMVTRIGEQFVETKRQGSEVQHLVRNSLTIWAGGICTRPITKTIAESLPESELQNSRRGLIVDKKLRIVGGSKSEMEDSRLFAIGDCAVVQGCAPTAQAAHQQGVFLGRLFRDTKYFTSNSDLSKISDFEYKDKGSLAYVGGSKGVATLKPILWNIYASDGKPKMSNIEGQSAYAIWRSLYFTKLLSYRNQAQVAFDWIKIFLFGRDISTPYIFKEQKKIEVKKGSL